MSRELDFGELEENPRERYAPSGDTLESTLAARIVDHFSHNTSWGGSHERQFAREIRKIIFSEENFDAQHVLDLSLRGVLDSEHEGYIANIDLLTTPLLQALYDSGTSYLEVNYEDFPESCVDGNIGYQLHGQPDRLLTVNYLRSELGACRDLGVEATHCAFTMPGWTNTVGEGGRDSKYHIEELPLQFTNYTSHSRAERCSFYVQEGIGSHEWWEYDAGNGRYELRPTEIAMRSVIPGDFWERGNRIFVPNDDGGWQEVRL